MHRRTKSYVGYTRPGLTNPSTTGTPFLGTISLEVSIGRDLGALKGLREAPVLERSAWPDTHTPLLTLTRCC